MPLAAHAPLGRRAAVRVGAAAAADQRRPLAVAVMRGNGGGDVGRVGEDLAAARGRGDRVGGVPSSVDGRGGICNVGRELVFTPALHAI